MLAEIKTTEDVAEFVTELLGEGLNYHPDENFENYVNMETGEASYTAQEALLRNQLNEISVLRFVKWRALIFTISPSRYF